MDRPDQRQGPHTLASGDKRSLLAKPRPTRPSARAHHEAPRQRPCGAPRVARTAPLDRPVDTGLTRVDVPAGRSPASHHDWAQASLSLHHQPTRETPQMAHYSTYTMSSEDAPGAYSSTHPIDLAFIV